MLLRKRGRDVSRLEGFSDAVFAFSATLLVVSLEVPTTFQELLADLRGFAAFGVSFGALMLIWTVHNAFFRRYGLQDAATTFLNACLLFVVLFYVYPLKFMAESAIGSLWGGQVAFGMRGWEDLALLFMLYGAAFVAVFLCVALLYRHAFRQRAALDLSAEEAHEARFLYRHYLIFVGVGLLSVGMAALGIGVRFGVPGFAFFLLGPLCYWHGVRSGSLAAAPEAPAESDVSSLVQS